MERLGLKVSGFCMKYVTGTKSVGSDTVCIEATRGSFFRRNNSRFQIFVESPVGVKNLVAEGSLNSVREKIEKLKLDAADLLGLVAGAVGNKEKPQLIMWFTKRELLVLNALADGPKDPIQLAEETGLSPAEALRGAVELISGNLSEVAGSDPNAHPYCLTDKGKQAITALRKQGLQTSWKDSNLERLYFTD